MKLLKFLRGFCVVAEVATALAALVVIVAIPFGGSMLAAKMGTAGIFFDQGQWGVSLVTRMVHGRMVHVRPDERTMGINVERRGAWVDAPDGSLTIGPLKIGGTELASATIPGGGSDLILSAASADATLLRPEQALAAYRALEVPLIANVTFGAVIWIAIFETLRRLFRAVSRGSAFGPASLNLVYWIGGLLIASTVVKVGTTMWVEMQTAIALGRLLPSSDVTFPSSYAGGIPGFAAGVIILALAEVFRQGFRLSEEARLTV